MVAKKIATDSEQDYLVELASVASMRRQNETLTDLWGLMISFRKGINLDF